MQSISDYPSFVSVLSPSQYTLVWISIKTWSHKCCIFALFIFTVQQICRACVFRAMPIASCPTGAQECQVKLEIFQPKDVVISCECFIRSIWSDVSGIKCISSPLATVLTWIVKASTAQHAGCFTYSHISFELKRLVNDQFWLHLTFSVESDCTDQNHKDCGGTTLVLGEWELILMLFVFLSPFMCTNLVEWHEKSCFCTVMRLPHLSVKSNIVILGGFY